MNRSTDNSKDKGSKKGSVVELAAFSSESEPQKKAKKLSINLSPGETGYKLMALIVSEIERQGISGLEEASIALNITSGHLNQLRTGRASTAAMHTDTVRHIAKFLSLSVMAVMMLAGQISSTDFYVETETLSKKVDDAINFISTDEIWGAMMPDSIYNSDIELKIFTIRAFETATGGKLLTEGVNYRALFESIDG